jgi:hypothetical protein
MPRDTNFAITAAAVSCVVAAAAQFHHVFVGFQNQEGPVERHRDANGGVEGVARVAEDEHVAVEGRGCFVAGAEEADDLGLARAPIPIAVFENLQPIDAEGEELGGGRRGDSALPGVAFEMTSRALGHTSCLSLPGESD